MLSVTDIAASKSARMINPSPSRPSKMAPELLKNDELERSRRIPASTATPTDKIGARPSSIFLKNSTWLTPLFHSRTILDYSGKEGQQLMEKFHLY